MIQNVVPCCWLKQHQDVFDALKHAITSAPALQYYNVDKPVTLTCDASKFNFGQLAYNKKSQ